MKWDEVGTSNWSSEFNVDTEKCESLNERKMGFVTYIIPSFLFRF